MARQRDVQPDEGTGADRLNDRLRGPGRRHVTLDNLAELAELVDTVSPAKAEPDESRPRDLPPSPHARDPSVPPLPRRWSRRTAWPTPPEPSPPQSGPRTGPTWVVAVRPANPEATPALQPRTSPSPALEPSTSLVPAPGRVRAGWARPADRWLPYALALAVASGAFVAPSIWLAGVAGACVLGGLVAFVATGHAVSSLPRRALRRTVCLLHPRSLVWVPVLAARTVLVAALLPAGLAAAVWIADEGTAGAVAAARAGAWADGFRVGAVLTCLTLLTSVGDGRHRRAAAVRRWASPLTDGTLVTLVIACLAGVVLVVVAAPHPADRIASRADGLGWLPATARPAADRIRDDIVTTELDVLASCLSERSDTVWRTTYSVGNDLGAPDVARLVATGETTGRAPHDLTTAVMAAHNQLAPWVEVIEAEWPGSGLVRTDRTALPRRQPITRAAPLIGATSTGHQWLEAGSADRAVALRCSVSPVL